METTEVMIEMVDPTTGAIESCDEIGSFRAENAEDDEVLDALDRIEAGESTAEAVGFYVLRVAQEVTA